MTPASDQQMLVIAHEGERDQPDRVFPLSLIEDSNDELIESLGRLEKVDSEEGSLGDFGEDFAIGTGRCKSNSMFHTFLRRKAV